MIRSIHISNFQGHEASTLELSSGVNVVLGETDSGKTSILRALNWVATNRPRGDAFVKFGAKSCSVSVVTDKGEVKRVKRPGFNGYALVTASGGKQEFKEIGTSVPIEAKSVLNIDEINVQSQLSSHFLVGLPPGQVSKALSDSLGFESADLLISKVKSGSLRDSKAVQSLDQECNVLSHRIADLEAKIVAGNIISLASTNYKQLKQLASNRDSLALLLRVYNSVILYLSDAREAASRLAKIGTVADNLATLDSISIAFDKYEKLLSSIYKTSTLLTAYEDRIVSLPPSKDSLLLLGILEVIVTDYIVSKPAFSRVTALKASLDKCRKASDDLAGIGSLFDTLTDIEQLCTGYVIGHRTIDRVTKVRFNLDNAIKNFSTASDVHTFSTNELISHLGCLDVCPTCLRILNEEDKLTMAGAV